MRRLLARFALLTLSLLLLSRLALLTWQWPRVQAASGLLPVLLGGLRVDLSMLGIIMLFPALLAPWLGHRDWSTRATSYWLRLWWLVLVLLELSTPQFVMEYDLRPNRLFLEYLVSPHEVGGMLWQGYKLTLLLTGIGLLVLGWLGWRYLSPAPDATALSWRLRPALTLLTLVVMFIAARGTLAHRPINPSTVAFSSDALVNGLALNSTYSVAYAGYQMAKEKPLVYGELSDAEVNRMVRTAAFMDERMIDARYPSLHRVQTTRPRTQPLNLVIVVQESLGAQFVSSLGGRALTPSLDGLMQQGWAFTRMYATGTRSARGLEAIVTGFLPTSSSAVLKLSKSQDGFFTLADLLDQFGYRSRFIYGGEAHFDNMRGFFLGNGFDEVHDLPKFTRPKFVGTWGASDEDMFNELHALLLKDTGQAHFTVAFSVSNHTPWEYPGGRIQSRGEAASMDNAVRYADWSLGEFFKRAQQAPYWNDTLFLVVADHDARVFGADEIPLQHFHIPAVILGGDIHSRQDNRLTSQIDLAPTLLSMIGLTTVHPMLGVDLSAHSPDRALMQYDNNFGYLKGNDLLVLKPDRPAAQFNVQPGRMLSTAVNAELAKLALAHSLWPVRAYERRLYRGAKHAAVMQRKATVLKAVVHKQQ